MSASPRLRTALVAGALATGASLGAAALVPPPLGAQARAAAAPGIDSAGFVVRLLTDTLSVERFVRSGDSLAGLMSRRLGKAVVVDHQAGLDDAARVRELVVRAWTTAAPGDARVPGALLRFDPKGTGVELRTSESGAPVANAAAEPGAVPMLRLVIAHVEQVLRRARALEAAAPQVRGTSREVPVFHVDEGAAGTAWVTPLPHDSVLVTIGESVMRLATDAEGRVLGGTMNEDITIERVPWVPLNVLHQAAPAEGNVRTTMLAPLGATCGEGISRDLLRHDAHPSTAKDRRTVSRRTLPAPLRAACAVRGS